MAPASTGPISTIQALLEALADRPDATVAELAAAAGMGRSTASKLLATLATRAASYDDPAAMGAAGAPLTAGH